MKVASGSLAGSALKTPRTLVALITTSAFISMALYRDPQESLEAYWEKELGRVVELGEFRSRADQALHDENLGKEDRDVLQRFLNAF